MCMVNKSLFPNPITTELSNTDVNLFVFHTDSDEKPTQLITYTQHRDTKNVGVSH